MNRHPNLGGFQVTHQTSDENNAMSTESDKTSSEFEMLAQQLRERVQRPASENSETIDIENLLRLLLSMDSEIDKTEQLRSEAERVTTERRETLPDPGRGVGHPDQ